MALLTLTQAMGLNKLGEKIDTPKPPPAFGAAADGDADRNMIMGSQFFCSRNKTRPSMICTARLCPMPCHLSAPCIVAC